MKIQILDAAEQDILDGFHFYEAQRAGLGDYFLDSLVFRDRRCVFTPFSTVGGIRRGAKSG